MEKGQGMFALPPNSDIHILSNRKCVINLNPEVSGGAFDLGVAEEELHGAEIAGSTIDQRCLGSPQ